MTRENYMTACTRADAKMKETRVEMAKDGSWADVIKYIERGRTVYDGEVKPPESIL